MWKIYWPWKITIIEGSRNRKNIVYQNFTSGANVKWGLYTRMYDMYIWNTCIVWLFERVICKLCELLNDSIF